MSGRCCSKSEVDQNDQLLPCVCCTVQHNKASLFHRLLRVSFAFVSIYRWSKWVDVCGQNVHIPFVMPFGKQWVSFLPMKGFLQHAWVSHGNMAAILSGQYGQLSKHTFLHSADLPKTLATQKNYQNRHDNFCCKMDLSNPLRHHIPKAIFTNAIIFFAKVNMVVDDETIWRICGHPNFDPIFHGLGRHVLSKS